MSIGISMKALKKILFINKLAQEITLGTSNVAPSVEDSSKDIKRFSLASGEKLLRVGRVYPGAGETSILPYLNESYDGKTVSIAHKIDVASNFSFTDGNGKTYYRVRLNTTQKNSDNFLDQSTTEKWVWTSSLLPVPEESVQDTMTHDPHSKFAVKEAQTLVLHPTLDPNIGQVISKSEGWECSVAKEKRASSAQGDAPLFLTIMVDGVEYNVAGATFDTVMELVRYGIALAILTDDETGEKSLLPVHLKNQYEDNGVQMYTCEYEADGSVAEMEIPASDLAMPDPTFEADDSSAPGGLVMDDGDLNGDGQIGDLAIRMKAFVHGNDVYYECLSYNEDSNGEIIAPAVPSDNSDFIPGAYFVIQSDMLPAREVINWLEGDSRVDGIGIGTAEEQAAAWNESLANGGLKKYYEKYPEEDIWDTVQNDTGGYNNIGCEFISYNDEGTQLATGKARQQWETGCDDWSTGKRVRNFIKVKIIENSVEGFVGNMYYVSGDAAVGDTLYDLYTDKDLAPEHRVEGIKIKITKQILVDGEHNILGAIYADGAQYPWIVLNFDEDVNARVKFTYTNPTDGQDIAVFPWGDKVFHKGFGCASLPDEFPSVITATQYSQDPKDGSIINASNFVPANLKIELVRD